MVDICGEPLKVGDKVSTRFEQLYRVGIVKGFTKTKVIVGFDFGAGPSATVFDVDGRLLDDTETENIVEAKFAPFNLTKIIRQNVGLADYYKFH